MVITSKRTVTVILVLCCWAVMALFTQAAERGRPEQSLQWPEVTQTSRPWTYWWWMGSAVNREDLTHHLETYRRAGMGGVHVIPIYGAKGREKQYINYLTPEWMQMLAHTVNEGKRVGMGVDMSTGTGWPFGGPWLGPDDVATMVRFRGFELAAGQTLNQPVRHEEKKDASLEALLAYDAAGKMIDLTTKVDKNRKLNWTAPRGKWNLYAVFTMPTGMNVKRAAPGAEGRVANPFSRKSLEAYLARFDEAFGNYKAHPPRAQYHDSYEYYNANWCEDLFAQFEKRRGYDLRRHLPALLGKASPRENARVKSDYRETISDMIYDCYIGPWVEWAHKKGSLTRNQAHGSPANILDLYEIVDIPETESYGTGWLTLAGMDLPPGIPKNWGGHPHLLANKFASSAAHVADRRLVSCETSTWLNEHFQVSLNQVKAQVDTLFVAGVNHVIFHGMAYSPRDAQWPGWLFYAATNFAPSNTFWRDFPALSAYITRVQSFLQAGKPANDVLVYFPIYDLWAQDVGAGNMLHYLQVHNSTVWLEKNLAATHRAARSMWDRGYGFDFISDRQIRKRLTAAESLLQTSGATYRVLVVPKCKIMPLETLRSILNLAETGGTVVFLGGLPSDVPGWNAADKRRSELKKLLTSIELKETAQKGVRQAVVGRGRVLLGDDLMAALAVAEVQREPMTDRGLRFIRRVDGDGWTYFITNPSKKPLDGWVELGVDARSAVIYDPRLGNKGMAALRKSNEQASEVYLQLAPGESCVLRAFHKEITAPQWTQWNYIDTDAPSRTISGNWRVEFVDGGPALPKPLFMDELKSWTEQEGRPELAAFSGTARYSITFNKPAGKADDWLLDLGRVHESVRVTLNGKPLDTLFARPFRVRLGRALQEGENRLEIEVTNLMANRVIDMGRRGVDWQKYFFVYMTKRPPQKWKPLPSGLLGPVRLTPVKRMRKL